MYDEKCEDLARYFYPNATDEFIAGLASALQHVVETWCTHEAVNEQGRCTQCGEVQ